MIESRIDISDFLYAAQTYQSFGYEPHAVPMLVDKEVVKLTLPPHIDLYQVAHLGSDGHVAGYYTGSAEQGFLQYLHDGMLRPGKYYALSPCLRMEHHDDTHQSMFLKLELIDTALTGLSEVEIIERLDVMILGAISVFTGLATKHGTYCSITTELIDGDHHQYDILLNGVEVGSYGIRYDSRSNPYIYGTGLAEPRFFYALHKNSLQPTN